MVKIIQSLGLDYSQAIQSTRAFEASIASLNKQLFEMKANALQGARDINQAFSSQLGNLGGMKTLVNQYGQPLKTIQTQAAKTSSGITSGFVSATAAAQQHAQTVQNVANKYNILASEWQRRTSWFLTGTMFYGTLKAAQEAVQTISEVEMGVTQIARVMEDSTFVFKDYRDQLLQLGVEYGQTFETVQDIALRWAQAGYNVKDSLELTRTSLLALNTAELDATKATESMIGIMAQWGLTAQDLPLVLDKINKTADDFTVTSQDLVDGLLRSSSAAKIMGLSIDQTIALLTVMREASGRTGREVGNALNSILSYIQRPSSIKTLESLGIQVFTDKARTQFRNVMEIFQDIASRWGTLSAEIQDGFVKAADDAGLYNEELANAIGVQQQWNDLQQRDISQAAAGVYRRNYFIAMIERLTQAQGVLNNMMDAAGYSMRENERTMDTLEKKYNSLKAAVQQLAVALGDAGLLDILKGLTDTTTDMARAFSKWDDNAKALVLTALELLAAFKALQAVLALFTTKGLTTLIGAGAALFGLPPVIGQITAGVIALTGAIGLYAYNSKKTYEQTLQDALSAVNAKKKEIEQTDKEIEETKKLLNSYEELQSKTGENSKVKGQLLEIQKQLASIYPEYVDALDEEGNKLVTNIPLLRETIALKQQELELERQKMLKEAQTTLPQLEAEKRRLEAQIAANRETLAKGDTQTTINARGQTYMIDTRQQLIKLNETLMSQLSAVVEKIYQYKQIVGLTIAEEQELLRQRMRTGIGTTVRTTTGGTGKTISTGISSTETNEALQNALRILEHKKRMDEISIQEEIAYLRNVEQLYVRNAEERMDIEERIYDAEKRLKDKRLQDSINWINEKKALDQLSAEEEIAAWERVLKNQKNNIEAVKEATINLHKLRKQLAEDIYSSEETRIQHLARLGLYTVQQQIDAYKQLYSTKAASVEDEYRRTEKLFDLYKDLLREQQQAIKDAYDERIQQIEDEAEAKKKAQQEIIDGIEKELDLLDRQESEYSYEQKMADLKEQLAYWSVRTSEEARQKVADINKQIDEAEHDREVELQRQKLEDKKKAAQDEIDAIEEAAKEEKEKWEKSYKLVEKAFDEHSINIIAAAGAMAEGAYQQWVDKYIIPLQESLRTGNLEGFENISSGLETSISSMSKNAQIYQLASEILNLKKQYEIGGDKSAAQRAVQYYNELEQLSPTVANALHSMSYEQAKSYVAKLPRSHEGSKVLTYGAAYLAPGELIFPPDLSKKLESLISALYARPVQQSQSNVTTSSVDNRKIFNGPLLNVENMHMEDEVDSEILSRELRRAVLAL